MLVTSLMTLNSQNMNNANTNTSKATLEHQELTQEWDKTFPKSDKVEHYKVTFVNRYGVTLAADMYKPKDAEGKLPAIAISGPFGAVKEQSSGLYAQQLAERGFLPSPSTPRSPVRAEVCPVAWPRPTSIPRISQLPLIFCRFSPTWMPTASAYSVFAVSAV